MQYKKQIIICSVFLLLNLAAVLVMIPFLTLHQKLKIGLIRPDIISVSMPLPENMTDAQKTFERLTSGFEAQYPGFGIDLKLYADGAQMPEDSDMYLNCQNVDFLPADLSEIYRELDRQNYLTEFSGEYAVPLSFCVPALYYDMTNTELLQKFAGRNAVDRSQLPENTVTENFEKFLENPENPLLSESSGVFRTEQNPASSGRIHMIPVTENGCYQKIVSHNICQVNAESPENKQKIAMLWIAYLLSEEAQTILFAENYGELPLHESAFDRAVSSHQEFYALKEIRSVQEETSHE